MHTQRRIRQKKRVNERQKRQFTVILLIILMVLAATALGGVLSR